MVSDEVGTKLVRFLYFVGAGVICTKGINLWRDYERKAAMEAAETPQAPAEMDVLVLLDIWNWIEICTNYCNNAFLESAIYYGNIVLALIRFC
ncbi:hypothetical protein COCNU_02G002450 [Cocos nucifera]|uniref:Uncharacterized protein n=1 Tax=Cocos nucifera TaxID=13894 RepID=A0A8K0MWD0_COCNU|nr:hypothetical protein COCNU_02G002450 [Cocos nucifera]